MTPNDSRRPVDVRQADFLDRNAFRFEVTEKEDEELFLRGIAVPEKAFNLLLR